MYDASMLEFCNWLEKKVLARDRDAEVFLKRLPNRQPWIYVVVIESGRGVQEAYEIDCSTAEWIKVYGEGWQG